MGLMMMMLPLMMMMTTMMMVVVMVSSVAEDGGGISGVVDGLYSTPSPLLCLPDIASSLSDDWTRLAHALGVTDCDVSHVRSTFSGGAEQARVMLTGWMASRQRSHGNGDATPTPAAAANELARALACIRRDDVVNAYLADVITNCARPDSATYADRGRYLANQSNTGYMMHMSI